MKIRGNGHKMWAVRLSKDLLLSGFESLFSQIDMLNKGVCGTRKHYRSGTVQE